MIGGQDREPEVIPGHDLEAIPTVVQVGLGRGHNPGHGDLGAGHTQGHLTFLSDVDHLRS